MERRRTEVIERVAAGHSFDDIAQGPRLREAEWAVPAVPEGADRGPIPVADRTHGSVEVDSRSSDGMSGRPPRCVTTGNARRCLPTSRRTGTCRSRRPRRHGLPKLRPLHVVMPARPTTGRHVHRGPLGHPSRSPKLRHCGRNRRRFVVRPQAAKWVRWPGSGRYAVWEVRGNDRSAVMSTECRLPVIRDPGASGLLMS